MIGPALLGQALTFPTASLNFFMQATPPNPNQLTPDQQFAIAREAVRRTHEMTGWLVPLAFFVMIAVIVWLGSRRRVAQVQAQAELRKQLLNKFATGQELAAFLDSKSGQQFLQDLQWRGTGRLRFMPSGVIITMLGLAFLGLAFKQGHFIGPGVILLAVGLGLLISATITHKLAPKDTARTVDSGSGAPPFPRA